MAWPRQQCSDGVSGPLDLPQDLLERRIATAEERLAALADGQSLCELSRAGAPGGVKDGEGRLAALTEVRRRGVAEADAVLASWERDLATAGTKGTQWQSYRAGGVDELRRLQDELAAID